MRRIPIVLMLALAAAACGNDDTATLGGDAKSPGNAAATGEYCRLAADLQQNPFESGNLDFNDKSAVKKAVQDAYKKFEPAAARAVAQAPQQIRADVRLVVEASREFFEELRRADYDFSKIDPQFAEKFQDEKFRAAADRVQKYHRDTCGIEPPGSS